MRRFIRRHKDHIVAGHGIAVIALLASSALTFNGGETLLYYALYGDDTLRVGDTGKLEVRIDTKVPINAIGATVTFPPESLEIMSVSKEGSFIDLWTEDTVIRESAGEVRFSGGTTARGGIVGTSTVLTLTLKAKKPGEAQLRFTDVQIFRSDGRGVPVESEIRSFSYVIPEPAREEGPRVARNDPPSPDVNEDGTVSLADLTFLTVHMVAGYKTRYDLDQDGLIGLSDFSIIVSHM